MNLLFIKMNYKEMKILITNKFSHSFSLQLKAL